jgi:hypothetical protein
MMTKVARATAICGADPAMERSAPNQGRGRTRPSAAAQAVHPLMQQRVRKRSRSSRDACSHKALMNVVPTSEIGAAG